MYITGGNGERQRFSCFSPGCWYSIYQSRIAVPEDSEEASYRDDLVFDVIIEPDDGVNTLREQYNPLNS